ncbi:MAG: RND family transporter [Pseudohongiellaceae bacterium]
MSELRSTLKGFYEHCHTRPIAIIVLVSALCLMAAYQVQFFRFDASADTMISQSDPELGFYNELTEIFGESPFLVLTYTPNSGELFSSQELQRLIELTDALAEVEGISGVTSLLDVPLLQSPPVPIAELADGYRTLRSADVDLGLAQTEFTQSPLFKDLLVSADGSSTAIQLSLSNEAARELASIDDGSLPELRRRELMELAKKQEEQTIQSVRDIRDLYQTDAQLYLGGVPMIRSDMVQFVKADMATFGVLIVLLLGTALYLFFKCKRWLVIPLLTVFVTVLLTMGVLAWLDQPATAVSSSFIALLAIVSISFSIHLITEYRDLAPVSLRLSQHELAMRTMENKLAPCVYTALTTGVAFASLTLSDIIPVIDFGWMMCLGIAIALVVSYALFASILVLLPKKIDCESLIELPGFNEWFAKISVEKTMRLNIGAVGVLFLAIYGVSQLGLGNRIVEYFRGDTEIRQGLEFIDTKLGGTVPLDIVIYFDPFEAPAALEDDPFDPFAEDEPDPYPQRFWFTPEKLATVEKLQSFIESRPETGKSVSISNLEQVGRGFTGGDPLSYLELTAILGSVPEDVRESLINPYVSPELGQVRISTRLHETGEVYSLQELITSIEAYGVEEVGLAPDEIHVTGVAVLFNGMLEDLLDSQLSTMFGVIFATFVMFTFLLRSITMALVGLLPNVLAALVILGIMGFAGIPLDMMTITIAAIVIGIGVDDAIHYLHRFKLELDSGKSAEESVQITHGSAGKALYFTSFTVIAGFSVLVLSRFMPTVYFGGLAALAMVVALTANLSLLPALLITVYKNRGVTSP